MNRVHPQSISFYRRLVKTVRKVFAGDARMIGGVLAEARRLPASPGLKMAENSRLTDPVEIQNAIFFGEEARDFLETNIIQVGATQQGTLGASGNYRFKPRRENAVSSEQAMSVEAKAGAGGCA